MKQELKLKCPNCQKEVRFNYYLNKFKCEKCKEVVSLADLKKHIKKTYYTKDDKVKASKILIKFPKEEFREKIKNYLKDQYGVFKKFKTITIDDMKLIYLPIYVLDVKCLVNYKSVYEINDLVLKDFTPYDKEILKSLFPINFLNVDDVEDASSLKEEIELTNILDDSKVEVSKIINEYLKMNLNNYQEDDIIFLEEKISIYLLPIYEVIVPYNNKEYKLVMNANTGKTYLDIPSNKLKVLVLMLVFLVIDSLLFFILGKLEFESNFAIILASILFITQTILIIYLTLNNNKIKNREDKTNPYYIKKIN